MKNKVIGIIVFLIAAALSGYYFYYHPSKDKKITIDCNYFRRVADVHWAEAKTYDDLSQDAREKSDLSSATKLNMKQTQKQALAEKWESYYTDCKKGD